MTQEETSVLRNWAESHIKTSFVGVEEMATYLA